MALSIAEFDRATFGVILHWGLYSVPAYDDVGSARGRRIQNGSEWYNERLNKGEPRTTEYHRSRYGADFKYADFAGLFAADKWDPDAWATLFRECGARYVVLTAKHHDGFCLWRTQTTRFNSYAGAAAKRDLVGELAAAVRKQGLVFGVYYSWMEFGRRFSRKYRDAVVWPQIRELQARYRPSLWWFDGDWVASAAEWQSAEIVRTVLKPRGSGGCLTNDRLGRGSKGVAGDWKVFDDRYLPASAPTVKWEHVDTIGYSWGRNRAQKAPADYKTVAELWSLFLRTVALGGNFLLNLGPNADGTLDAEEVARLREFGSWVKTFMAVRDAPGVGLGSATAALCMSYLVTADR